MAEVFEDTVDRKKSGRPMKLSERERRILPRISKKNPFWHAREVWNEAQIIRDVSLYSVKCYMNSTVYQDILTNEIDLVGIPSAKLHFST